MKKKVWIPIVIIIVVLFVTYISGPEPPKPIYNENWPELPQQLNEVESFINKKEAVLPVRKDNQARIKWYKDSVHVTEYSFIYLHGFAGSYRDGYPVNVNVADTFNSNIFLARWAGHGLKAEAALEDFSPDAAWESAKEALAIGRRIGKKVIIMSTSTGGTLAIKLAATYPDSVHAIINISPNIEDDQTGAFLLHTNWGFEIAKLVSLGENRKIKHKEEISKKYWDTIYPSEALVNLQVLVNTSMRDEIFKQIKIPVITLFYHKNIIQEDKRVQISRYPEVHKLFSTPDSLVELVELEKPGSHFIGSDIKSKDWRTAQQKIIEFCQKKLDMKVKGEFTENP